jgi:tRNA threonylcarbamoyladenosine biosynthesis protein TsaE
MEQTYTESETPTIARRILSLISPDQTGATVVALQGDLGAGKTTLTKTLANELGVQETVVSPTFVIAKFYETSGQSFQHLVHIDAYRIESTEELQPLGWNELLNHPNTLVVVEWPEHIQSALPKNMHHFSISHDGEQRTIRKIS